MPEGPPGGDVGLVGALVGAEARVAIDAEEALLGGADVVGREVDHGVGDLLDEREHGVLELALVDRPCAGSNQARSLWRASPRRNLRASGVKCVGIGVPPDSSLLRTSPSSHSESQPRNFWTPTFLRRYKYLPPCSPAATIEPHA